MSLMIQGSCIAYPLAQILATIDSGIFENLRVIDLFVEGERNLEPRFSVKTSPKELPPQSPSLNAQVGYIGKAQLAMKENPRTNAT